ncbi:hypothetical protein KVT40_009227 [Elsinoe batatas]|uniref:Uncharacterized protein n=1 Tax=Elsinoe batatas TaxID=2601811 RepID=A0A8K0KTB7_9PEZI|nr:hypothetical protein KVT40_009227 [Elsinoe batatas]
MNANNSSSNASPFEADAAIEKLSILSSNTSAAGGRLFAFDFGATGTQNQHNGHTFEDRHFLMPVWGDLDPLMPMTSPSSPTYKTDAGSRCANPTHSCSTTATETGCTLMARSRSWT